MDPPPSGRVLHPPGRLVGVRGDIDTVHAAESLCEHAICCHLRVRFQVAMPSTTPQPRHGRFAHSHLIRVPDGRRDDPHTPEGRSA